MDPSDQKMVSTFSSGIIGGMTGTSSYASGNNSSPLYDMGIRFNALGTSSSTTTSQDSYAFKQWENIVFPAYVQYIQRNLNYQFTLDEKEFGEYIEAVSDALQLFYTIESIMAYANNPDTVNDAVYSLRAKISASMYNDMYLLKERLEQMVIPPAIHEMIYNLFQNYSMGTVPGAPIVRFSSRGLFDPVGSPIGSVNLYTSNGLPYSKYTDYGSAELNFPMGNAVLLYHIEKLRKVAVKQTASVLRQVFDGWKISIKPCTGLCLYDPQIANLWTNITTYNSFMVNSNYTAEWSLDKDSSEADYVIHSYTNMVDGVIQLLTGPFLTDDKSVGTGFINPYCYWTEDSGDNSSLKYYDTTTESWEPCHFTSKDGAATSISLVDLEKVLNAGHKKYICLDTEATDEGNYRPTGTQRSTSLNTLLCNQPSDQFIKQLWAYNLVR
jgi:hypothetical protein